jgi:GR25 family glycosyltransferase involved in LPS biosynthesis
MTKIIFVTLCKTENKIIKFNNKTLKNYYKVFAKPNTNFIQNTEIFIDCQEIYENLPIKMFKTLQLIDHNLDYDYIFKFDNDCIINPQKLNHIENDYIGLPVNELNTKWHFNKCHDQELNTKEYTKPFIGQFAGGGHGYILSKKSVQTILKFKPTKEDIYEDKFIGDTLKLNGINFSTHLNKHEQYKSTQWKYFNKYENYHLISEIDESFFNKFQLNTHFDKIFVISLNKRKTEKKINDYFSFIFDYEIFDGIIPSNDIDNDFNSKNYQENYQDLKNMNNVELENHWYKYGQSEGRSCRKNNLISNTCVLGCLLSHREIIKQSINKKYKKILILEEDFMISDDFQDKLNKYHQLFSKEWKLFYFGSSQLEWNNISFEDNYYHAKKSNGTFAYGIDSSIFQEILDLTLSLTKPIDTFLHEIQNKHHCVVCYPNLIIADLSKSNIRSPQKYEIYKWNINDFKFYESNFDINFYVKNYYDLQQIYKSQNEFDFYDHYIKWGYNEGRFCCLQDLKKNTVKLNKIKEIDSQIIKSVHNSSENIKFTFLVRTSNRQERFNRTIESIKNQNYSNYDIIVSTDSTESKRYCIKSKHSFTLKHFNKQSGYEFYPNEYLNIMIKCVDKGYIIILDDDDYITCDKFLTHLCNEINKVKSNLIIWKYLRPDKIIYPKHFFKPKKYEIATCSYCFNINIVKQIKFIKTYDGDFDFFDGISKNQQIHFIDKILTSKQDMESIIGTDIIS